MSCSWPVDRTCYPALPTLSGSPTDTEQAAYDAAVAKQNANEDQAVAVLWALSGRQFGACETTVRPCPATFGSYDPFPLLRGFVLLREGGHWLNFPCGCIGGCSVSGPRVVHLPGPVSSVESVTIEGIVLDPDGYQLEGDALYRRGGAHWPRQDLGRPLGETGTWSVTYLRGNPAPAGVAQLVGLLAKEFLAACDGGKCRLPRTVVSTTQRGVTHTFDPTKLLASGKTGLPEVDTWLAAVNPNHLTEAPAVV